MPATAADFASLPPIRTPPPAVNGGGQTTPPQQETAPAHSRVASHSVRALDSHRSPLAPDRRHADAAEAANGLASSDDELARLKTLLQSQTKRLRERTAARAEQDPLGLEPFSSASTPSGAPPVLAEVSASDGGGRGASSPAGSDTISTGSGTSGGTSRANGTRKPPRHIAALPASAPHQSPLGELPLPGQRQRRVVSDDGGNSGDACSAPGEVVETVRRGGTYYVRPEDRRAQAASLFARAANAGAGQPPLLLDGPHFPTTASPRLDAGGEAGDDSEEMALTRELDRRTQRMRARAAELRQAWANPPRSVGSIAPSEPRVLAAATEVEVREQAAAAEDFAKSQAKLKQRLDEQAERHRSGAGSTTTSTAGPTNKSGGGGQRRPTKPPIDADGFPIGDDPAEEDGGGGSDSSSAFGSLSFFGSTLRGVSVSDGEEVNGGGSRPQSQHRGKSTHFAAFVESNHRSHRKGELTPRSVGPRSSLARSESRGDANERSMASLTLGRMSMASCSMARATDGALAVMEMLANRPDVVLPSPAETGVVRTGDVLSARYILKLDLQDALRSRHGPTGMISGAPYFRIVPKLNIAGVAQANISAIRTIVNELRRAHVEGPVIWVNLREEPLVYINNQAHIVRERHDPLKPVIIPNVTGRSIEAVEAKLKEEVLQEAYENGGNISVHVEGKDGLVEDQWECADPYTVYTLKEVFQHLAVRSHAASGVLHYFRRPITQNIGPQPSDFDFVLDACLEEPKAVFVFNCQTGRGRTSAMMQIASMVRFYQLCVKDVSVDVRVLRGNSNTPTFRTIQKLVSLFPDGKLHERRLNILMELADKVYSMADHIQEAFSGMDEHPEEAVMRLQQYALFLVFSYYCEQRLWNYAVKISFTQWLDENPDMRLLIYSIRDKLKDQLKEEQIITAVPHRSGSQSINSDNNNNNNNGTDGARGDPPDVVKAIRHRRGNVLSAGRILCSVPMASGERSVRALRQLAPDVPIFTCGRMGGSAREELVREVRESFPGQGNFHWLSLRAEPMVIINEVSYTLTDFNAPLNMTENGTTMHVSVQGIEQIEDRLRRDVLLEAQEHGGFIIVHHLDENNNRTFTRVKVCSVRTSKSIMEDFVNGCHVSYCRVPIPFSGQMLASDIDPLLRFLEERDVDPHDIIVINDSEGSTRTSVALNILLIHRAARLRELRTVQTTSDFAEILRVDTSGRVLPSANIASAMPVAAEEVPEQKTEPLLASTICQMLTAGSLLRTVDAAIALSGRGVNYNILHRLDLLKKRIGVVGTNKPQCILDAIHGLRSYLLVLLTALYLDDPLSVEVSFSRWVSEHTEVCNIIDNLEGRGEAALKYVASDNLMKADVSRRSGDVLTANFCLKADHFPGCQKKGLRPELCGAPNFRKVNLVNVYGVAIPTQMGIHNVLSLLGASNEPLATYPGQSNDTELYLGFAAPRLFDPTFQAEELQRPLRGSVVWVNLREEPILYVGDRPFVFRDLAAPYVNVELTGIQTDKIELVETQLKVDVLNEAQQYGGKFLVHDEGTPGELVGHWEPASNETVKTLREVYGELEANGARCQMVRLPVTDEQSPDIGDFDLLVTALLPRIAEHLDRRETLSFVFNCQMGRGRTTTGMVVCCLLIGLVIPEYYDELHNTHNPLYLEHESDLWRGDYGVISQLKRVLTQGRSAKYKVDLVLEECSKMQNLRTAIESFAVAERSPDNTEAARARAHHAGVHYLVRYFNLIVFAVYLEEAYDRTRKRMSGSFVDWMRQHPELTALAATAALK